MIPTSPSPVVVDVEVIEAVGLSRVFINSVNAVMVGTTGQGTLWRASLFAPAGAALQIVPVAIDLFNNQGYLNPPFVVDNDGISAAIDLNRQTFADGSRVYSNDFVDGVTSGTIARDGASKVVAVRRNGGVGLNLVTPGSATISACAGTAKWIVLNSPGEGVDVTCAGTTINVRAYTPDTVEVYKQLTETRFETRYNCYWVRTGFFGGGYNACYPYQVPITYTYVYQITLRNGQGASTGSPVTAAADNTEPIHVDLLQVDDAGGESHAASFELDAGESADVAIVPGVDRQDQLQLTVLQGTVPATVGAVTQTLGQGPHTFTSNPVAQTVSYLISTAGASGWEENGVLPNVLKSLDKGNSGAACNQLGAFLNQVRAQSGKSLTAEQAATLIELATAARAGLGCQ
jgi:hypothetical protein